MEDLLKTKKGAAMQVSELKERIKKGNVLGVYIFAGEEDYLKRD